MRPCAGCGKIFVTQKETSTLGLFLFDKAYP